MHSSLAWRRPRARASGPPEERGAAALLEIDAHSQGPASHSSQAQNARTTFFWLTRASNFFRDGARAQAH
eukprot:12146881-Alexandrium_andersonii.AAC.1